jgi:hypothetical protein
MPFALLSKQVSRPLELPDSSEFLNPMSGKRWRIIGEKVENELFRYTKSR